MLREAFQVVQAALAAADVPYAIGGSWASAVHGEPRQTNDIDIVAAFDTQGLKRFLESLGDDYYYDEETARGGLVLAEAGT
ncbi:MAG TPA: hypothetical protein DEH78_24790 [Solibacterales bacterium]|nr:hypothetical protein [Bryobacterales bacterium]